jgi:hypothetical protein
MVTSSNSSIPVSTALSSNYCKALCYYLAHLRLDLHWSRMEFLRDNADRICAMLNGYSSSRGRITGNYGKYKVSCYASQNALTDLQRNNWSAKGLMQEHVIPIKVVGEILLQHYAHLADQDLLDKLNELVIPCVITDIEDQDLNDNHLRQSMPNGWTYQNGHRWARYQVLLRTGQSLISQIVALRPNLPATGGPAFSPPVSLPPQFQPGLPIPNCLCLPPAARDTL